MNPLMLIAVVLLLPFMVAALLLVPLYLAMILACYLIYIQTAEQGLILENVGAPDYILSAYLRLVDHWITHMSAVSFLHYTAPLILLPLVIFLLAAWLSYRFLSVIKDQLNVS